VCCNGAASIRCTARLAHRRDEVLVFTATEMPKSCRPDVLDGSLTECSHRARKSVTRSRAHQGMARVAKVAFSALRAHGARAGVDLEPQIEACAWRSRGDEAGGKVWIRLFPTADHQEAARPLGKRKASRRWWRCEAAG